MTGTFEKVVRWLGGKAGFVPRADLELAEDGWRLCRRESVLIQHRFDAYRSQVTGRKVTTFSDPNADASAVYAIKPPAFPL